MTLGTNAETHGPPRHQRGEQDRDHTPDRAPWRPPAGGYHDKPCPVISGKLPALGTHHKGAENRATPNLLEKLRKSASAPATQQQGKETQATCRLARKIARAQSHHRQGKEGGKTQVEAAEPKPTTATDPEDGGIGTPTHRGIVLTWTPGKPQRRAATQHRPHGRGRPQNRQAPPQR